VKLYDLKKGDIFRVILRDGTRSLPFRVLHVDPVDGRYSYCTHETPKLKGEPAHIMADAEVEEDQP
jgi:hypothetical protein